MTATVTSGRQPTSLRKRIDAIVVLVLVVAISVLTFASAIAARIELVREERLQAAALLDHLVAMPYTSQQELEREIANLAAIFGTAGGNISITDGAKAATGMRIVAERSLRGQPSRTLRYTTDGRRTAALTRSIVVMHVAAAAIGLSLLLIAIEWTLRRRLVEPLAVFRNSLDQIAASGRSVDLPAVDEELVTLRASLGSVGPAVTARTMAWFESERERERRVALARLRAILDERVPAVIDRIERITRGGRLSVLSLNEIYAAEEEVLSTYAALTELHAVIESPEQAREGHA